MAQRAKATRREEDPLKPVSSLIVVGGDAIALVAADHVTAQRVGHKAFGLASLPPAWSKPFFVVLGDMSPDPQRLAEALVESGIGAEQRLLVRSSGVHETIERRGTLESFECTTAELASKIERRRAGLHEANEPVHWVVQAFVPPVAKGHLSNERRIAEDKRDWVCEIEAAAIRAPEILRIPLRDWRDKRPAQESVLVCSHREAIVDRLASVARWTYERLLRVHFEWVWDGQTVYIVQADPCEGQTSGQDPHDLVASVRPAAVDPNLLEVFRAATDADFAQYRKLANAKTYAELGYKIVPFFVLDIPQVMEQILVRGRCSAALLRDLGTLTKFPLVIRTDGGDAPAHLREMLPRSDELRSPAAAKKWLLGEFRRKVREKAEGGQSLSDFKLCLVAHHFVPACAAAWCQALPDQRRVRIESLWGIPEGLYWYAYDVFDVDTRVPVNPQIAAKPNDMTYREKRRYKERFVAPDHSGAWVVHRTSGKSDWVRSITKEAWIHEIAWTSRCIAAKEGKPVVVMWLVDTATGATEHRALPWYHQEWKSEGALHKAAPRKKFSDSAEAVIRTRQDWNELKEAVASGSVVARIRIDPREPEMVRDQLFVADLGVITKKYGIVVELSGGILSHAYYMLSRAGCQVECADLDDFAVDEDALEFNKLVRDGIPAAIASRGESVAVMKLRGEALVAALRQKLVEEALEVLDAKSNDQIAEELADLVEVGRALMTELGIEDATVESARRNKLRKRGGFNDGIMLGRTAIASPLLAQSDHTEFIVGNMELPVKSIERAIELPNSVINDAHVDRRYDVRGAPEQQLTVQLPVHADGLSPARVAIDLPSRDGVPHQMSLDITLEREGGDLRLRLRLRNASQQLQFDFSA